VVNSEAGLEAGLQLPVGEATLKVCGVGVVMLPG
jgi:hypothetical protein